jgi:hypothetical protein
MANQSSSTEERIRRYFKSKAAQMKIMAAAAICEHPGLIGSYREELQRIYFREILPSRFDIGKGMIYGQFHKSREVDIVIWDHLNYTSLPLNEHSFFFPESVRTALECKSAWSASEFKDVLEKTRAVMNIIGLYEASLTDVVRNIDDRLRAIESNTAYHGALIVRHHIGTAAIFLTGGNTFDASYLDQNPDIEVDDAWPDIMLLLESGKLVLKTYDANGGLAGSGRLEFYEFGEDALLVFTNALLSLIEERSVLTEPQTLLPRYTPDLADISAVAKISFPLTRPPAQRTPFWTE